MRNDVSLPNEQNMEKMDEKTDVVISVGRY